MRRSNPNPLFTDHHDGTRCSLRHLDPAGAGFPRALRIDPGRLRRSAGPGCDAWTCRRRSGCGDRTSHPCRFGPTSGLMHRTTKTDPSAMQDPVLISRLRIAFLSGMGFDSHSWGCFRRCLRPRSSCGALIPMLDPLSFLLVPALPGSGLLVDVHLMIASMLLDASSEPEPEQSMFVMREINDRLSGALFQLLFVGRWFRSAALERSAISGSNRSSVGGGLADRCCTCSVPSA